MPDSLLGKKNVNNDKDLTFEEKIEALTVAYEQYEEALNEIYQDFLMKITEIRKEDDKKKLENLKTNVNNSTNA